MPDEASRLGRLWRSPVTLPLLFLVGILLIRAPVLLSHLDSWYPFEIHAGSIATALLDGLDLDWGPLPVVSHIRGGVLLGLVLVPAYALFGVSSLVFKATVLAWHGVTVALMVYILARFFTRRVAAVFGTLMFFAPPVTAKLAVLGLASHMESPLFSLLALLPFLAMTIEGRFSRWRWFAFGMAVGFAGFFHLQALLPCLLLLGLVLVLETRRFFTGGVLWVLLGAALGSAPSFVFDGGNVRLLRSQFSAPKVAVPAESVGALSKIGDLAGGDFASLLEFGEVAPPAGELLGLGFSALLLVSCLIALWHERLGLLGFFRRVFLRENARCSPALFFLLHALLVVALFGASKMESTSDIGSGLDGRRLAPLLLSVTALAAIGLGGRGAGWIRNVLLFVPLCAMGAAGLVATATTAEASHMVQRGECYEWFGRQLGTDEPGSSLAERIARIDRGDPRYRPLRFPFPFSFSKPSLAAVLKGKTVHWKDASAQTSLYRWVQLGRELGLQRSNLVKFLRSGNVSAVPALAREALFHGVGLSTLPPRPVNGPELQDKFMARLNGQLRSMPEEIARAVAEGYGMRMGLVFDPYSPMLTKQVAFQSAITKSALPAFYRGLGWGVAQRYVAPPTGLPPDLSILELIPRGNRLHFRQGFLSLKLPREAAIFTDS